MTRRELNHSIRALANGRLGLDEEEYRSVVHSITGKRHITGCNDEEANLVLLAFRKMRDNVGTGTPVQKNVAQQKFIARLMQCLGWDWKATAAFCLKVTGKRSTKACNAAELSKIIRGMIAVIDHHVASGKISMTHTQKFNYERHVQHQRTEKRN